MVQQFLESRIRTLKLHGRSCIYEGAEVPQEKEVPVAATQKRFRGGQELTPTSPELRGAWHWPSPYPGGI